MNAAEPATDSPAEGPAPETAPAVEFTLQPRRVLLTVFLVCALSELAFFLLDWHVNYARLVDASPVRNLFNTTREDGAASWFGITQTAFVAATLWLVFFTVRARKDTRWVAMGWLALALFFSYMAFDDGSAFHERMGSTFKIFQERAAEQAADSTVLEVFPSYPWQVLFLPVFATAGLFILGFLWWRLREGFSRLLVIAAIGFWVTAVGLDFIEGLDEDHPLNLTTFIAELPGVDDYTEARFNRNSYRALRHFGKSLEETIEMFGMTLLWIAILRHWMLITADLRVRFRP